MRYGTIQYSPDYKSEGTARSFGPSVVMKSKTKGVLVETGGSGGTSERALLEHQVIKAAKDWRKRKSEPTEGRLFNAVCALESFEARKK